MKKEPNYKLRLCMHTVIATLLFCCWISIIIHTIRVILKLIYLPSELWSNKFLLFISFALLILLYSIIKVFPKCLNLITDEIKENYDKVKNK